jgi:hypothetical protein
MNRFDCYLGHMQNRANGRHIHDKGEFVLFKDHELEISILIAERDELQRRLGAVVAKISEAVVSDDDCVCSMLCHSAIIAIAEGRDNE